MTAATTEPFHHEAVLYDGIDSFVDATLPFIFEGLIAGEPIMVATTADRLERLREALTSAADGVELVDMAGVGRNPARKAGGARTLPTTTPSSSSPTTSASRSR